MLADVFRHCSNTDRTCVGQQQLHRHQEFYGGLNDRAVGPWLLRCVVVDCIKIAPSTEEVQGLTPAECAQSHCQDTDILLCKQFKLLIIKSHGRLFVHEYWKEIFTNVIWVSHRGCSKYLRKQEVGKQPECSTTLC